jgi:hypothetical protein
MKTENIIKWVATFITLVGSIATVLKFDPLNVYLLNLGALMFLIWAIMIKERAMIVVNLGLLAIYAFGVYLRCC